ncbi:MAG: 3-phosphoserine/phosphohydroxythreonine transaminase [Myxococcales bacterium]|nr:3-phosphoserine/phosphohydroxythreonine transaminase [Myxococcales bacterium]MCB9707465.1 3-phosphoserine/phosphohydroxythreonine transaminase [Myxococcales bacterium]
MPHRVLNFNPGPSALPLPVLEHAQKELLDFKGTGMSVMEHSHRGKEYEATHNEAIALLRELLGIGDNYHVLFLQGGARGQFAMIPMNLLAKNQHADYVLTGAWSEGAQKEAEKIGAVNVAATTKVDGVYRRVPKPSELHLSSEARYVHITSNNTIFGTQFHTFPETGSVPLVADMSSDIVSRELDVSKFGVIYAGAQKNMGPAGVTVVIIRKDLVESGRTDIPEIFQYAPHAKANSLLNTPPTFSIYMVCQVLRWLKKEGGLASIGKVNQEKASMLYRAIAEHQGFYRCDVEDDSRSIMNVVFNLPTEALEKQFVTEATQAGMIGLKGHRSVGGIRASIYNAVTLSDVTTLVEFMGAFEKRHR